MNKILKKDLKVSEVELVDEERIHNKRYKGKGYWNEFEGKYCKNKSKRVYLNESKIKIYDFNFYSIERIKKDFNYENWEDIAMFLTVLYKEHFNGYKFNDWGNVYMNTKKLKLYLRENYNKILDRLSELGIISVEKKRNVKYFNRGFCKYISLNKGFRVEEGEVYVEKGMVNKRREDAILKSYQDEINNREGVEKYVEGVLDTCEFDLGDKKDDKNKDLADKKFKKESSRLLNEFLSEKDRAEIELKISDENKFKEEYIKHANDYYDGLMMKLNGSDWERKFHYNIKVDEYGNRLSHIVSNMPKVYREELKINGEEVVEIDIVSSQVAFLTILLNKLFDTGDEFENFIESSFGGVKYSELKKEVSDKVNSPSVLMERLGMMYSDDSYNDRQESELDLYKFMGLKLKGIKGLSDDTIRTEMKGVFMGLLFGSTKFEKYKGKDRKEIINEVFGPDFFELLQSIERLDVEGIEKKKYRNLSALLQREESKFINEVMDNLMKDKVLFLPLYDCLIVKKGDKERVEQAFNSVITKNGYEGIIRVN